MACRERCPKSKLCRSCTQTRKRQRTWTRKKFAERMSWAKSQLGNRCAVPDRENMDLEFDHLNPNEKEANIPRIWSRTFAVFEAEVRKCQLLCHEHHVARHAGTLDASFCPHDAS